MRACGRGYVFKREEMRKGDFRERAEEDAERFIGVWSGKKKYDRGLLRPGENYTVHHTPYTKPRSLNLNFWIGEGQQNVGLSSQAGFVKRGRDREGGEEEKKRSYG
jgi:hypothetical protein